MFSFHSITNKKKEFPTAELQIDLEEITNPELTLEKRSARNRSRTDEGLGLGNTDE